MTHQGATGGKKGRAKYGSPAHRKKISDGLRKFHGGGWKKTHIQHPNTYNANLRRAAKGLPPTKNTRKWTPKLAKRIVRRAAGGKRR